ncbi:MAG: hypothetical protein P4L71_09075 [Acetobacteraceae bacterium]|nr:hypothetical protein [Acetobacteraceae bacterium]
MADELRLDRTDVQTFETTDQALAAARAAVQSRPESAPEIRDTATGEPFAPAASKAWRDHLAEEVGF